MKDQNCLTLTERRKLAGRYAKKKTNMVWVDHVVYDRKKGWFEVHGVSREHFHGQLSIYVHPWVAYVFVTVCGRCRLCQENQYERL